LGFHGPIDGVIQGGNSAEGAQAEPKESGSGISGLVGLVEFEFKEM
jgi:hypothetical protein